MGKVAERAEGKRVACYRMSVQMNSTGRLDGNGIKMLRHSTNDLETITCLGRGRCDSRVYETCACLVRTEATSRIMIMWFLCA